MAPTASWWACRISARPITRNSTRRNGDSSKSRNCALYKGTVWASWDPSAPPFLEYLGDFARYLDLTSRRLGRQRGRQRDTGRHPEMAHSVQLEIPGREFLRRQLSQYQPPLGRSGRHWPVRQRPPRHAGAADGAALQVAFPERGHQTGRLHAAKGPADAALLPVLLGGRRILCALRRRAAPPARRVGTADRQPGRNLSQYCAASAPAAHDRGMAPAWAARDRGLALVPGRSRRRRRRSRISCATITSAIPARPG